MFKHACEFSARTIIHAVETDGSDCTTRRIARLQDRLADCRCAARRDKIRQEIASLSHTLIRQLKAESTASC